MPSIDYSGNDIAYKEQVEQYIRDYCAENNLDPSNYIGFLDGKTAFDPTILRNPVIEEYMANAHATLLSIIDPVSFQALFAQIEGDQVTFDDIERWVDPELVNFIEKFLLDSPEAVALLAGSNDPQEVLNLLRGTGFTGDAESDPRDIKSIFDGNPYKNEEARRMMSQDGFGAGWNSIIDMDEKAKNLQSYYMGELIEIDEFIMDIHKSIISGTLEAEEGEMKKENLMARREWIMMNMSNLEDTMNQMFEFLNSIMKAQNDSQRSIANRIA